MIDLEGELILLREDARVPLTVDDLEARNIARVVVNRIEVDTSFSADDRVSHHARRAKAAREGSELFIRELETRVSGLFDVGEAGIVRVGEQRASGVSGFDLEHLAN